MNPVKIMGVVLFIISIALVGMGIFGMLFGPLWIKFLAVFWIAIGGWFIKSFYEVALKSN